MVKDSVILLEQIRTIDKKRLREKICILDEWLMRKVDRALLISIGLSALSMDTLEQIRQPVAEELDDRVHQGRIGFGEHQAEDDAGDDH